MTHDSSASRFLVTAKPTAVLGHAKRLPTAVGFVHCRLTLAFHERRSNPESLTDRTPGYNPKQALTSEPEVEFKKPASF